MKAVFVLVGMLFLYMAYIQLNDPDPLYWIAIYAGTAAIAFARFGGRNSEFWTTILLGVAAGGMIVAAPSLIEFIAAGDVAAIGEMQNASYVEPAREFVGLLIALGFLLYCYRTGDKVNPQHV